GGLQPGARAGRCGRRGCRDRDARSHRTPDAASGVAIGGLTPRLSRMAPSSVTAEQVLAALRPIVDPDFGKSIVDLGFIKNLAIEGGRAAFDIELTTPACPVKSEFERAARERVAALPGVSEVAVTMTANTRGRASAARLGQEGTAQILPGVRNVLAVASGKG